MNTRSRIVRPSGSHSEKNDDKKKSPTKKEQYTPPLAFNIPPPSLIDSDTFTRHLTEIADAGESKPEGIISNLEILYSIYRSAQGEGGLLYVSSIGSFPAVVRRVLLASPVLSIQ
jgi:hypothetical protein